MLITYILVAHVTLAVAVSAGFIYRYILAFKQKAYPTQGRKAVFTGSVLLVISGVALSGIGKLPITGLCLDSLGLITSLLLFEFGLHKFSDHLETAKNNIKD